MYENHAFERLRFRVTLTLKLTMKKISDASLFSNTKSKRAIPTLNIAFVKGAALFIPLFLNPAC